MLPLFKRTILISVFLSLLVAPVAASACPNETSPGFRSYLPDCRAYELVSPAYKEGFPVYAEGISEDGEQLRFESLGSFSNPDNTSSAGQSYLVKRENSEWQSAPLDELFSSFPVYHVQGMSTDFESSLWFASVPGQSARAWDVYLDSPEGHLTRMGPGVPAGVAQSQLTLVGASDDLLHILLLDHSPGGGGEEDRLWPGDATAVGQRYPSLYEYEGTGNSEPRLVGVSNEERVEEAADKGHKRYINEAASLISVCGTVLGSPPNPNLRAGDAYDAVSMSGGTVFFTAEACGGSPTVNEVYARIDGRNTIAISEPSKEDCARCETFETEPGKRSSAVFQGASRDGSKVFFLSEQELLPGANGDNLYEFNFHPEEDGRKANEKVSLVASRMASSRGDQGGVARVSEDGSRVDFVSEEALTGTNGEGKSPVVGEPNLYVFASRCPGGEVACGDRVERVSFVGTLSRADEKDWSSEDVRPVQTTPNGGFVVFQSVADLTGDQEGQAEAGQIFEYSEEMEALVRVSRGENGYNNDGNTSIYPATIPIQSYEVSRPEGRPGNLTVSKDGSHIFFSSADALTPRALNGVCIRREAGVCVSYANNIYEFHDGQVALIPDGHDVVSVEEHPATELIGTDESGRDVFFTTADRLVPQDSDTLVDIYDAREGGGFVPAGELTPCSPGACHGPAGEPLSLLAPVTTVVPEAAGTTTGVVAQAKKLKVRARTKPVKRKRRRGKTHRGKKKTGGRK